MTLVLVNMPQRNKEKNKREKNERKKREKTKTRKKENFAREDKTSTQKHRRKTTGESHSFVPGRDKWSRKRKRLQSAPLPGPLCPARSFLSSPPSSVKKNPGGRSRHPSPFRLRLRFVPSPSLPSFFSFSTELFFRHLPHHRPSYKPSFSFHLEYFTNKYFKTTTTLSLIGLRSLIRRHQ